MKQIANDQSPEGGRAFDSILCAMATAVYFAFVLPLQTYLANAESFTFGLGDVVCGCCLRMLCLAVPVGILQEMQASLAPTVGARDACISCSLDCCWRP